MLLAVDNGYLLQITVQSGVLWVLWSKSKRHKSYDFQFDSVVAILDICFLISHAT